MDLPSESVERAIKNLHVSYSYKSNTPSVQDTQPFIQTANQFALVVVSKPYLKWISFGQSTSVPNVVSRSFSAFIGETITLYSASPPQSILCSRCWATKEKEQLSSPPKKEKKKNVSFEVFYLLFFIVADYDTDCFHCAKSARCFVPHWLQSLICVSDIVERSTALTHTYKTKTKHWLCSLPPCCTTQICFLFIRCIVDCSFFHVLFYSFFKTGIIGLIAVLPKEQTVNLILDLGIKESW